jgi:hypothetical protein
MTSTVQAILQQAAADLQRGDRAAASDLIKLALRQAPDDADAWFLASFTATTPEDRAAALERAVQCDPAHHLAQQALRRARQANDHFDDLRDPAWRPDVSSLLPPSTAPQLSQLPPPAPASAWERWAFNALVGVLVVIVGLLLVYVLLPS